MTLVVRAFPVNCDRAAVEELVAEMHKRGDETRRFYNTFSVRREAWFWQDSVHCPMVIGVTEVGAPVEQVAESFAKSTEEFASWFKQRVQEVTGVDPNVTPLGPPSEQVFNFQA